MKILCNILILLVISTLTVIASDKVLTSIRIDDIDAGGVYSRASMGSFYNANNFYVFYPGFYSGYVQRIKVRHLKLQSNGRIENHDMVDLNDIKFPAACTIFDSKLFVVASGNGSNPNGKLKRMTFDGNNWSAAQSMPVGVSTHCGVALVELNNVLFCFYKYTDGSLRFVHTENGLDWSGQIVVNTGLCNPNHGTIAACTFIDNDNLSKILVSFTHSNNSIIYFQVINGDGSNGRSFQYNVYVNNISMIQGSTHGGIKGNVIQIIFSQMTYYNVYKVEYSIRENLFSGVEVLDWGVGNYGIIGDQDSYVPGILYSFISENKDKNQKYIISYIARFYKDSDDNYRRDLRLYSWKSDIFKRDRNDTGVTDYNPHPSLCKLIGVIEGPPPFTYNGYDFNDWGPQGFFPPSSLEYGIAKTSTQVNTSSVSSDFSLSVSIGSFTSGFGCAAEELSTISTLKTITHNIRVEPTENNGIGYRIFLKPIIQRKKYFLYDWSGLNLGFFIYLFRFEGPYVIYEPFKLSETGEGLDPNDIYTYHYRSRDFENYSSIQNLDFEWTMGTSQSNSVSLSKSEEHSSSSSVSIDVGLDVEFGDIFKIEADYLYDIEYKLTATTAMKTDFTLSFNCPGLANNPDHIKRFDGKFYWLLPTNNKDNWWVPKEYEKDNPWLMTYNVHTISKDLGIISDVLSDEINEQDIFKIYPNPVNNELRIEYKPVDDINVRIEIRDMLNNKIKCFNSFDTYGNNEVINWDLKDLQGNEMPSGLYFITLYYDFQSSTKNFFIIR